MATGQYIGVNGVARKVVSPYVGVDGVARNVKSGYVGVEGVARLFFAPESGAVVLEVEKITSNTYANETTYTSEEFILLDIYPKTGGTVNVTYGGLTKTITDTSGAEEPNAQQVFFGTFNGVSDSVATPASGTLTIEGGYSNFACGRYHTSSKMISNAYCGCITNVVDWGSITSIADYAFHGCTKLALTSLPSCITSIGDFAFYNCTNLALTSLPSGVTSIRLSAFYNCTNLALTSLPSGVTHIGGNAFYNCNKIAFTSLPSGVTSIGPYAFHMTATATGDGIRMLAQTMTVPSGVTYIGDEAFSFTNTSGSEDGAAVYIATVKMLATTPPTIVGIPFGSVGTKDNLYALTRLGEEFKIEVPSGCGNAYKTAENWSHYADYIVEAA